MTGNRTRTVEAYDAYAPTYAELTRDGHPQTRMAIERFAHEVGAGAGVLELASGPGWDADALEALGLTVVRTELSDGFIRLQRARGKGIERLDLVTEDLGGPWDGIVALYVMQHVERSETADVLTRIAVALKPGALLLTSFQEGAGERDQTGSEGGTYRVIRRSESEVAAAAATAGLILTWRHAFEGDDARWILLIARRP
ncbi:MAG TPA: class I SAM-dependent methyltransferase [Brevundimonas sp.]|uniref:class I SAM-dependent methyltransferase n=1 Tax=Brevundimonas sp. TaxID=1871086 RepID=UPI002DEC757C|nr:class I SAM-dependent methyltransferase [Brevundimonas sp.]